MRVRVVIAVLAVLAVSGLVAPGAWAEDVTSIPSATAETEPAGDDPTEDTSSDPTGTATDVGSTETSSSTDSTNSTDSTESPGATAEAVTPRAAAAAAATHDPRASVGDVDCTTMTVAVTLDNTRSTESATFVVNADTSTATTYDETFVLAAGATRVVQVPVTEDSKVEITVADQTGTASFDLIALSLINVNCTPDGGGADAPSASIGDVDCELMSVPVTLDNSRVDASTTFQVIGQNVTPFAGPGYDRDFTLEAGETLVVHVPVTEDARVIVGAGDRAVLDETGEEEGVLALELVDVDCVPGRPGRNPRASIGSVRCPGLTIPVTLDNTRSDTAQRFEVAAGEDEVAPAYDKTFEVAAEATRVVQVPVRNHSSTLVVVTSEEGFGPLDFDVRDANCPAARVLPSGLDRLPDTGGFPGSIPLAGLSFLGGGAALLGLARRRTS